MHSIGGRVKCSFDVTFKVANNDPWRFETSSCTVKVKPRDIEKRVKLPNSTNEFAKHCIGSVRINLDPDVGKWHSLQYVNKKIPLRDCLTFPKTKTKLKDWNEVRTVIAGNCQSLLEFDNLRMREEEDIRRSERFQRYHDYGKESGRVGPATLIER